MLAAVNGMNRHTGRALSGVDHIRQSILDILTTPLGSRVCNREYGSALPDLVDAAGNDAGIQAVYAATAVAIATWYPFVTLHRIAVSTGDAPGSILITLEGHETGAEQSVETAASPFNLSIPFNSTSFNSIGQIFN